MSDVKKSDTFTPSFVVGIDLGTSRSGFAFAMLKRPNEIICELEGGNGQTKDVTAVLLKANDLSLVAFGDEARRTYLDLSSSSSSDASSFLYFEKFKMCLYGEDLKERPFITATNGKRISALDVFAAALSHFRDAALHRLGKLYGSVTKEEVLWVVTLPAVWSPGAKQLMREACTRAGLCSPKNEATVLLALESEAASICCREREVGFVNANACVSAAASWKPGFRYIVVDIGCGTTDVTVHRVTDQNTLGEVIASSGGPFGSACVDDAFNSLLQKIFGTDLMDRYRSTYPVDFIELMSDFEMLKRTVTTRDERSKRLRLPLSLLTFCAPATVESKVAAFTTAFTAFNWNASTKDEQTDFKATIPPGGPSLFDTDSKVGATAGATAGASAGATAGASAGPTAGATAGASAGASVGATAGATAGASAQVPIVQFSRGQLILSHDILMSLFDPVVRAIVAHVTGILSRTGSISHLFLVGGFSESQVIRAAVENALGAGVPVALSPPPAADAIDAMAKAAATAASQSLYSGGKGMGLRIVTPPHSALAVLTGAVIFGLKPHIISSRIVKYSYGICVSCPYNPAKHSGRKQSFRINNGKSVAFCDGIFSPFCLAGDEVPLSHSVSQAYTPGEDNQDYMILKIYQSKIRNVSFVDAADAQVAAQMNLTMPNMTGNLERKV